MRFNLCLSECLVQHASIPNLDVLLDLGVLRYHFQRCNPKFAVDPHDLIEIKGAACLFDMTLQVPSLLEKRFHTHTYHVEPQRIYVNQQRVTQSPHSHSYIPQQPFPPENVNHDNHGDAYQHTTINLRGTRKVEVHVKQAVERSQSIRQWFRVDLVPEVRVTPPPRNDQQQQP